jgi:hypothetical protein
MKIIQRYIIFVPEFIWFFVVIPPWAALEDGPAVNRIGSDIRNILLKSNQILSSRYYFSPWAENQNIRAIHTEPGFIISAQRWG